MSIEFDELADRLSEVSTYISPSEVQGVLTGLACGGAAMSPEQKIQAIRQHLDLEELTESLANVIREVIEDIDARLGDFDSLFEPMLPDDDEDIYQRSEAIAYWCQGFLVGFGTSTKAHGELNYSEDMQAALKDIVDISNLEPTHENDTDVEKALFEITEYLRVAAPMIYMELAVGPGETEESKPSPLH